MGCGGSTPSKGPAEATTSPAGPSWNAAEIVVYTCADSTDDDDANFIMKGPDGKERKDMDATMVLNGDDKMLISKSLMEGKTLKFYVVKVMPGNVDKIIKVEVAGTVA